MDASNHTAPANWDLGAAYSLIAELLLNPDFRDADRIALARAQLAETRLGEMIDGFLADPAARDVAEYTETLELSPPVPLYFGAYMYEEPSSCRGAGASGRNQYMIDLDAVYAHFGVATSGEDLPDFVPMVVEFLAISLDRKDHDGIGLRRYLVETYVLPGIAPLRAALQKYESVYDRLIEALQTALEEDLERMSDDPVWLPPDVKKTIPTHKDVPGTSAQPMQGR